MLIMSVMPACVSLAPGADKVKITEAAADVGSCTTVGNFKFGQGEGTGALVNANNEIRNKTLGLGGNTAYVTSFVLGEGMAYRCP
jgi:hypothetical protein